MIFNTLWRQKFKGFMTLFRMVDSNAFELPFELFRLNHSGIWEPQFEVYQPYELGCIANHTSYEYHTDRLCTEQHLPNNYYFV